MVSLTIQLLEVHSLIKGESEAQSRIFANNMCIFVVELVLCV